MANRHTQKFPSGEVRVFEAQDATDAEPNPPMVLVEYVRAPGDPSTDDLTGTAMQDMPPPFEPAAE